MLGARGHILYEKILKIWCALVYILIRLYLEKIIYFMYKIIIIATRLLYEVSYIAPGNFCGKHVIIDAI